MHIKQRASQWVSFVCIKVLEGVNSNKIFYQVNWWILILYEDKHPGKVCDSLSVYQTNLGKIQLRTILWTSFYTLHFRMINYDMSLF